jgi:hypothetical protein
MLLGMHSMSEEPSLTVSNVAELIPLLAPTQRLEIGTGLLVFAIVALAIWRRSLREGPQRGSRHAAPGTASSPVPARNARSPARAATRATSSGSAAMTASSTFAA